MNNGWYKILNGCRSRWNIIWDYVFPNFCLECGKEGEWWCPACRQKFPFQLVTSSPCQQGQNEIYLDQVLAFFNYTEDCPPARLLKQFKYGYVRGIEVVWKNIIAGQLDRLISYQDFVLVPVPLHSKRERERGFNQSHVLASLVQNLPGWQGVLNTNLKRIKYTECQAGLNRERRLINLKDAFVWMGVSIPHKIILVDDVYTTGTTMNECAKVLKKAGAGQVFGLVLAKGG